MDFAQIFAGFMQPVAIGSAAVLLLLGILHFRSPRRSAVLVTRRPNR